MSKEIDIRGALSLHRDDQPVFLKVAEDMLTRIRSQSEIKVLKQVVREYEVTAELIDTKKTLLEKMEAYKDAEHSYETQQIRQQRKDEIAALTHDLDVAKLKNETKRLNYPSDRGGRRRLSRSELLKLKQEEKERQLEDARLAFEHEVRYRELKDDIFGAYEENQRTKRMKLLDQIKEDYALRLSHINNDHMLTPLEKEAQVRALRKEFIRQLDDFEAKL